MRGFCGPALAAIVAIGLAAPVDAATVASATASTSGFVLVDTAILLTEVAVSGIYELSYTGTPFVAGAYVFTNIGFEPGDDIVDVIARAIVTFGGGLFTEPDLPDQFHLDAGTDFLAGFGIFGFNTYGTLRLSLLETDPPPLPAVPLPATAPLLAGALGLAGAALRRNRHQ